jgi:hypothetical protein
LCNFYANETNQKQLAERPQPDSGDKAEEEGIKEEEIKQEETKQEVSSFASCLSSAHCRP